MAPTTTSFRPYRLRELASTSPTSFAVGASMLLLAGVCAVGLAVDPRQITGAPAWLKPLKFAVSAAIYCFSFPWLLLHLEGHRRFRRVVEPVMALVLFLEVALIAVQAARGVPSHFNVSTIFDMLVFNVMGSAIALLWVLQIWTAVLVLRQRFDDPVLAASLRFALVLTVLGAGVGWLMTTPSRAQMAAFRSGHPIAAGAHTVGGPDGGAGLPLTNWSLDHGDLRVAHFVGLHALQLLPFLGLLASRVKRISARRRLLLVRLAGASYLGLFALLLVEALAGVPLASSVTLIALATWGTGTLAALLATGASAQRAVEAA